LNTLRSKFLLYVLAPVIAVMLALSVLSYMSARKILYEKILKNGENFLKSVAEGISASAVRIRSNLDLLALSEELEETSDDVRRILFVRLTEELGEMVTSVFMGFPDGRFIRGKKTPLPQGYDPRTRPWYADAVKLPPDIYGGVTAPYLDAGTRRTTLTIYRKVMRPDGSLIGVIGIDLDTALSYESMTKAIPLPEGGNIFFTSSDARVLFHHDDARIGKDLDATGETLDRMISAAIRQNNTEYRLLLGKRNGEKWYAGYHRVPTTKLYVVLTASARAVQKPLNRLTLQMAGLALPLTIGILILLIIMARRITSPIEALKISALKVTEEESYQEPLEVQSRDEVGQLTEAFNNMMEGLRQRDFIRDTFGRYVTKEVVEELLGKPDGLELGGETKEVTIMFSDLRGFTPLSERLAPEEVIGILNRYLGRMAETIAGFKGTVNEFMGDGILTIFGAPVPRYDSPTRAVACAVAMQLAMTDINQEHIELGLPAVSMGIGINTGEVIVGNIGSKNRVKYGVVGHHINLTARVESVTTGGQILITESTFEKVGDTALIRDVRRVSFKGVDDDVKLYDIAGVKEPYNLTLPDDSRVMQALKSPIQISIQRMIDKTVSGVPIEGTLTHISGEWAKIILPEPLGVADDIRAELYSGNYPDPVDFYAKVFKTTPEKKAHLHLLRISFIPTELNKILEMKALE
jgi:class 3 adenylate cyclase